MSVVVYEFCVQSNLPLAVYQNNGWNNNGDENIPGPGSSNVYSQTGTQAL